MSAELLKRQFLAEIVPQLFPDNNILNFAVNDDPFVNGNSVEIQNSGTLPEVMVDNEVYPIPVQNRADVAHNYELETLTTKITQITSVEKLTEAGGASKRASVSLQQAQALRTKATSRALVNWATGIATAQTVATTGASAAATLPIATGNRKAFTKADLLSALEVLMSADIPVDEMNKPILVVPPTFYTDILAISDFVDANKLGSGQRLINGQIGEILGVRVMMRSLVLRTDASDVVKAESAAAAATDQHAAILYHPAFVRKAVGSLQIFLREDDPQYGGDIMNTQLRFGSTQARNDKAGIVMIFEDTV